MNLFQFKSTRVNWAPKTCSANVPSVAKPQAESTSEFWRARAAKASSDARESTTRARSMNASVSRSLANPVRSAPSTVAAFVVTRSVYRLACATRVERRVDSQIWGRGRFWWRASQWRTWFSHTWLNVGNLQLLWSSPIVKTCQKESWFVTNGPWMSVSCHSLSTRICSK